MADEPDDFEIEHIGDTIVFRFRRKSILDEQSIGWFGENLFRVVDTTPQPRIVLDFRNVIFISSAGLGKLITLHRKVQGGGGWLKIVNLRPDIVEVLRVTRLDTILDCNGGDEDGGGSAGVPARLRPPPPSGGVGAALPPPPPADPGV